MEKHIDKDCIFCELANGEIPTTSIYEDEDFECNHQYSGLLPAVIPSSFLKRTLQISMNCQMIIAAEIMRSMSKKCGCCHEEKLKLRWPKCFAE